MIDLPFEVILSSVHEDFNIDLKPIEFAKHYAKLKTIDVAQREYIDYLLNWFSNIESKNK